jgi:16S rRNA (adenine1518-N6/adenine1519-N6)-dimethyltransferase
MRLKPKKSLGQNFLVDKNIRNKIINACDFKRSDTVLEIGAGRGELTSLIATNAKFIYALEIDPRLTPSLKELTRNHGNLKIIEQDVLKLDIGKYFRNLKGKLKVFGNIPYYISTPIIEQLIRARGKIDTAFITVQKEFAERIVSQAGSKEFGSLSCFVQYYMESKILFSIPKSCFYPAPKVCSAFLRLKTRKTPLVSVKDEALFFKVIRTSFNQRRKTLKASLKKFIPKQDLEGFLRFYGIRQDIRPEKLSPQDFARLTNFLKKV